MSKSINLKIEIYPANCRTNLK